MRTSWWRGAAAMLTAVTVAASACAQQDPVEPPAVPTPSETPTPTPSPTTPSPTTEPTPSGATVQVFFSDLQRDPCRDVRAVPRTTSAASTLRGALEALLAGPTATEQADGLGGWFSAATAGLLLDVRIDEEGRALVSFASRLQEVIPNASSSCGSISLLAMLDATVAQFPDVRVGVYSLEGDRTAFYGWLQMAAPGDPGPPAPPPEPDPEPEPEPERPPEPEPVPAPGDRGVPASLHGTEWTSLPTPERVVALTFDGGANADGAAAILDTLAATGTPATFFLTGNWVVSYPTFTASMGARYPVGNHTSSHPDLTELSDTDVRAQLLDAHDLIVDVSGRDPRPWFRFPYGARDDRTIQLVNGLGYGAVRWSTDTLGWQGTSAGQSTTTVIERVMADLRPGQIVLLHLGSHPEDGSTLDADALPQLITRIRAAGYALTDLDSTL